jgi:molecular chaperone HtpG
MSDEIETSAFRTKINQLTNSIVNAFSTNKEICLRELTLHGSDALEQIRYHSLKSPSSSGNGRHYLLCVGATRRPCGSRSESRLGMTKSDLITVLGGIGWSRARREIQAIENDAAVSLVDDS